MSFMIQDPATSAAVTPPSYAMPSALGPIIDAAPVVRWHEPTARSAAGTPVGASQELYAIIGRSVINAAGLAWWYQILQMFDNVWSAPVTLKLFNPFSGTWDWYTGTAWRPTFTSGQAGNKLRDFKIYVSNLTAVASPE